MAKAELFTYNRILAWMLRHVEGRSYEGEGVRPDVPVAVAPERGGRAQHGRAGAAQLRVQIGHQWDKHRGHQRMQSVDS